MKKTLSIILILGLFLIACAGCASEMADQPASQDTASEQVLRTPAPKDLLDADTDALGNAVAAAKDADSDAFTIVSTAPNATEILFALGCGNQIVGVDIYSTYPAETADIEKVGDFNGFDIEKVIALNPSVVFAGNGLQIDQITALENAGLNVVAVEATYFEDITASITLIGSVVGKEQEAVKLNAQIDAAVAAVQEKTATITDKPTVYYVMGIGEYGNWTSGEGSFINTMIEMAGGVCTTADSKSEWMEYPVEDLVTSDPDILLVSENVTEQDLLAETGYKDLSAIKNGTYYFVDPYIIERPGPRITQALDIIQGYISGETSN